MLNWFFKREKELDPIDFSVLETDMHSHFIPGIDDGSPDMETSIFLINKMKGLGYTKLITSPHVMSDCYQNTSASILDALKHVKLSLNKACVDIDIDAVAEYYIDFDFESKIGKEKYLTFGDNYILVECSFIYPPQNFFDIIFKLQLEGYKVVLAHPERYSYFSMKDYKKLVRKGVFLQINLLSIIGYYSLEIKKKTEELINQDLVSFVGSDCHHIKHLDLYHKCYTKESWHMLVNSGNLLNDTL